MSMLVSFSFPTVMYGMVSLGVRYSSVKPGLLHESSAIPSRYVWVTSGLVKNAVPVPGKIEHGHVKNQQRVMNSLRSPKDSSPVANCLSFQIHFCAFFQNSLIARNPTNTPITGLRTANHNEMF